MTICLSVTDIDT